jgi:hypothetical protein
MYQNTGVFKSVETKKSSKTGNDYTIVSLFIDNIGTKRIFVVGDPSKIKFPVAGQRIAFALPISERGENPDLVWNDQVQFKAA